MNNLETSVVEPTPLSGHNLLLDKVLRDGKAMPMVLPVVDEPPISIQRSEGALIQDNSPHRETKL
jgi:hypothetical protein